MHRSRSELDLPASPADHDDSRPGRPPPGLALDPPDAPAPDHPPEIPVDRLDQDAIRVIARLRHMHHQAYFVGGCVRDLLLGATPKDFDVATDAHPGEVRAIFRNCRLIGRRFRLAHVYFRGGKVIEVATFRKNPVEAAEDVGEDVDLLIARDNVFGTAEEDAVRRDFTVNGLFYDVASGEVIDYCGGRADLEAHRIATIGDPEIRMREDPVRALRAVRFAARLGFTIAPDTFEAMRRHAGELARCAPARVLEEIFKILRCGASARAFELLRACGALPVILPALGAAHEGWDEARRRSFSAHLSALDRLVRAGEDVSDAVLLGALIMHLGAPTRAADLDGDDVALDEAGEPLLPPPSGAAEALLASLVQTSRLPRKVAERTRLALHAQRAFSAPPKRRRRRGRGMAGQPYFVDAVHLLRLAVDATGHGKELLERWQHDPGAPAAPARQAEARAVPADVDAQPERPPRHDRGPRRERAAAGSGERGRSGGARDGAPAGERSRRNGTPITEVTMGPAPERHRARHAEARVVAAEQREPREPDIDDRDDRDEPDDDALEASDAGEAAPGQGASGEPGAPANAEGRRKRRRRGGRRRRRRGAGAGGSEPGAPSAPVAGI
jgi:poly(A) polymerase